MSLFAFLWTQPSSGKFDVWQFQTKQLKTSPLSSPENPICHHSQFILPLICTDHHLIVPLPLWKSQPLGPWTHLLSAGLSTRQNQIIYHVQEMKVSAIIRETSPIDSFLHGPVALTHKDDPNHWPCVSLTRILSYNYPVPHNFSTIIPLHLPVQAHVDSPCPSKYSHL